METRLVLSTAGGAFYSWLNAYLVRDEDEGIESVIPMAFIVCVSRRPVLDRAA